MPASIRLRSTTLKKYLLSFASLVVLSTATQADTYLASTWLDPGHILTKDAYVPYLEDIRTATGGKVDFELHTSASLLPPLTTLSGVGDGVAQIGLVAASYTPSELPLSGLMNDLAFLAKDPMAISLAFTELLMFDQRFIDEYARHNTVALGGYSTPIYLFACMKDVVSAEDARGTKFRTNGRAQNEFAGALGGVPVSVPINDVYSGLERGSLDCALIESTNLVTGPRLGEVIRSVTKIGLGTGMGVSYVYNKDFWNDIGPEARRQILDVTARGIATQQIGYETAADKALEQAEATGTKVNEPQQSLLDTLETFRQTVASTYPEFTQTTYNVADPSDIATQYQELEQKWIDLLAGIDRSDVDAVAELIHAEIFAKIDENSHAL